MASEEVPAQKTIHITDLAHIQRLAQHDLVAGRGTGILDDPPLQDMKYEISAMPIGDIIEMVAALLTKITTTNDLQHDALNRNATHQRQAQAQNEGSEAHTSPFSTSVLAFHGKNVPAITILSYLSRIHKYCPTTYEVFLSLLVYFDRMTDRVNELVIQDEEERKKTRREEAPPAPTSEQQDAVMQDSDTDEMDEDLADSDDEGTPADKGKKPDTEGQKPAIADATASTATYFVVDSFNIHRLIIAGVTCASKFFSDVFYTNSRYAKVRLKMRSPR
jgi:PHO85 cyclin-6/7